MEIKIILLLLVFLAFNYNKCIKLPIGNNPYVKKLRSGHYMIVSSTNITFYDDTFDTIINSINFEQPIFSYELNYSFTSGRNQREFTNILSTTVEQFTKEDGNYIVALVNKTIYIFDKFERLILNKFVADYIDFSSPKSFSIITYGHFENNYYFYILYTSGKNINYTRINYIRNLNEIDIQEVKSFSMEDKTLSQYSSCGLMNYNGLKVINCFYGNSDNSSSSKFEVDENYQLKITNEEHLGKKRFFGGSRFYMKVIPDDNKKAFCYIYGGGNYKYFIFDISTNDIVGSAHHFSKKEMAQKSVFFIDYFYETKEILIGAINIENNIYITRFNTKNQSHDLLSYNGDYIKCNETRINFILSPNESNYYLLLDASCDLQQDSLIKSIIATKISDFPTEIMCYNYYNYNRDGCLDTIPPGYYCNSTQDNTIDNCHPNCETCNQGPDDGSNNCLTCPNDKYFNLGDCVSNCSNGYFTDENNTRICKCLIDSTCHFCNKLNKCLSCNEGYFMKFNNDIIDNNEPICFKEPEGYYLEDNLYKPCYSKCKFCSEEGNANNHKCTRCIEGYSFKNDFPTQIGNCYEDCKYNYYYDSNNNYKCTLENDCPNNYKLILDKKKCVLDCKNDDQYQYEYKNICFTGCPINSTSSSSDAFICEEIIQRVEEEEEIKKGEEEEVKEEVKDECNIKENPLNIEKNNITEEFINLLAFNYVNNSGLYNNFISKYENDYYLIYIYKNINCLKNISSEIPILDFGQCYEKIQTTNKIINYLITILILIKEENGNYFLTRYIFSNPDTGKVIKNSNEICSKDNVIITEDISDIMDEFDEKKKEDIIFLTKQGIDVFNLSDEFYNDLCYFYESPNNKDICMKDRISYFFPNITLCEPGCKNRGVDLDLLKVQCECSFNDFMGNKLIDNALGNNLGDVIEIINSANIEVLKCIKYIFDNKRMKKCIGGLILSCLLFCKIIVIIIYSVKGINDVKQYVILLNESFSIYLNKIKANFPPKKTKIRKQNKSKSTIFTPGKISRNNLLQSKDSKKFNNYDISFTKKNTRNIIRKKSHQLINKNIIKNTNIFFNKAIYNNENNKNKYLEDINEMLNPPFDENDLDEVIEKDQRTLCQYFCANLKDNQIFVNTFCQNEDLKPRPLKIILLILTIELYFTVNAIFYNEDYLSELFQSNKKDKFFSFVPRRFNHFVYISLVNGVISYLIGFFFDNEKNLKRIFKRIKKGKSNKSELMIYINSLKKLVIGFIVLSIILSIIFIIYISCFNIVYPYITKEWIISSIFILIIMQLINILLIFIQACVRYLSIKFKSIKLFELSLWLL